MKKLQKNSQYNLENYSRVPSKRLHSNELLKLEKKKQTKQNKTKELTLNELWTSVSSKSMTMHFLWLSWNCGIGSRYFACICCRSGEQRPLGSPSSLSYPLQFPEPPPPPLLIALPPRWGQCNLVETSNKNNLVKYHYLMIWNLGQGPYCVYPSSSRIRIVVVLVWTSSHFRCC